MKKNDKLIVVFGIVILIVAVIGILTWVPHTNNLKDVNIEDIDFSGEIDYLPNAITVSDDDPFYALIATPLAVHYDEKGQQQIIPLYVKNFDDPSRAVERAEDMIGISSDLIIGGSNAETAKDVSLEIAETYWKNSNAALLFGYNQEGYNLGVSATPLAAYLGIPIIVTDVIDEDVRETLDKLGVTYTIICGNISGYGKQTIRFTNSDMILNETIKIVQNKFGRVEYITLTNPLDTLKPEVINETVYHFEGTVTSSVFTPTHAVGIATGMLKGIPMIATHEFDIPKSYKYARVKIHVENLVDEDISETGGQLQPMFYDPDGNWLALAFTVGGIPERDSSGNIIKDQVDWETTIYNNPGTYTLNVAAQFLTKKTGEYEIDVTVEELNSSIFANMPDLSSIAPYLTAYRKGVIYAEPDFVFVGDERIIANPPAGVVYPASNPDLIDLVNDHVFSIHESLNKILSDIRQIDISNDNDLELLKIDCDKDPMYIAIVGDDRMVPYYYYYDTPDAVSLQYGWDVASDFIYGNVDPVPRDDKISIHPNDMFLSDFDEKYPHQENIVGRITGWDVQDASALVTRTIFYENIVENLGDDWKNTALVQTGSGTDFQRVPAVDLFRKIIGAHDLPFKWPTGEAHFENLIIQDSLDSGNFKITSTENTESMREGISEEVLQKMNRMGILNLLLFPKMRAKFIAGEGGFTDPNGQKDQETSNFIFTFGHGQPMGYSHGDVQTNSVGFRPVLLHNIINRFMFGTFMPQLSAAIGNIGGYYVRSVENMDMGPSVMFVESCYIGRIDGFPAKCTTSQAYLHAGVNTFIASSRGTPGPGYLDARKHAKGFGISEFIRTRANPSLQEPHFSALHAVNIFNGLIQDNVDVGTAFRNAKNKFMKDANSTFYWTPPLSLQIQTQADLDMFFNGIKSTSGGDARCMEKKYTCLLEYNLFGDPAFNPYEPVNNG